MTTPSVKLERPSSNLTIVVIGSDLEFAFSYTTIVAFRAPTNPKASWLKSVNVWTQTTGRHLGQLPGGTVDHVTFTDYLTTAVARMGEFLPGPVGEDGHEPESVIDKLRKPGSSVLNS